jgi:two-component system sensor histidine kinase MtrB
MVQTQRIHDDVDLRRGISDDADLRRAISDDADLRRGRGGVCADLSATRPPPHPTRAGQPAAARTDPRGVAALAVLAGDDVGEVARRLDLPVARVLRYVEVFRAAGIAAVTGTPSEEQVAVDHHLGTVAHEMRAPITAVQTWVEVFGTGEATQEEVEAGRRIVLDRLARLERLCDDLLDVTALRLGCLRLCCTSLDLAAVVTDAVAALDTDRVIVEITGRTRLNGDADRLDQVMTNLLTNALVHGAPRPVLVHVRGSEHWVEVAVRNAGPLRGTIDAGRIFDAYERGCGSGHGLGLSVTRALVLAHDGTIEVRLGDDVTEFVVRLPVDGPAEGSADSATG